MDFTCSHDVPVWRISTLGYCVAYINFFKCVFDTRVLIDHGISSLKEILISFHDIKKK